jgi:hypothetical protein
VLKSPLVALQELKQVCPPWNNIRELGHSVQLFASPKQSLQTVVLQYTEHEELEVHCAQPYGHMVHVEVSVLK